MSDVRTLPIPAEHREFSVKVQGQAVSREHQLIAATVVTEANRVASARLVYLDGAASQSSFPLSNSSTFVPGSEVEILGGSPDKPVSLFKGVVVAQSLKIRESSGSQLVVECRHKAFKLTVGRKNTSYFDQSDSDILSAVLGAASIACDVETTTVVHAQQVQFRSTDWDFLVTRAEANGKLVYTEEDKVIVKAPSFTGTPAATLLFGATILEFDAHVDARRQWSAVKGVTWDPAQQALVARDGADPAVQGPGNLKNTDLAGVAALPAYELRHAALAEDEAQAWADAQWLRSQMTRVSGRAKCEGIGDVKPGDLVNLSGVGDRYGGTVLVTGVRHDNDPVNGWKTHLQFGSAPSLSGDDTSVAAAPAGALVPPVSGLQIGTVTSNEDPTGEHRVRVSLPLVDGGDGVWARVSTLDAGVDRGTFFRPEIGDEVVVGFLDDDPRRPVLLGMLHSSNKPAPLTGSDDNHEKVYQSRSKLRVYFNDDLKTLVLETPAGNKITLSDQDKGIKLEDQNGNVVALDADGIRLESKKAVNVSAMTDAELKSQMTTTVKGLLKLKLN